MAPTTRAAKRRSDLRRTVAIAEFKRRDPAPLSATSRLYIEQALASPPGLYQFHFGGNPAPPKEQLRAWLSPPVSLGQREAILSLAEEMRSSAQQRRARPRRRTRRPAAKRRGRR